MNKIVILTLSLIFVMGIKVCAQTNIWDENPIDSQVELDSLLVMLPKAQAEEKLLLLNRVAEIYWTIDPNKTIEYASQALQLAVSLENKNQEGLALINLCQGYLFNDYYDKALQYGLQSLEIRKTIGNPYDLAFTWRTLGWLYYDIGYFDKALKYHEEALALHEEIGDQQRIAYSYNSIGLIHEQKGDCKLALSYFKKSLDLKRVFNNKHRIAETIKNMGVCYRKINEFDSAKVYLDSAFQITNQINDNHNKVYILNELAIVNLESGDFNTTYELLNDSELILETISDNKELILEHNRIKSDYYQAVGNYKAAIDYYKAYTEGSSQIFSSNKSEKLTEMRVLYEAERRESEIKLLEQQKNLDPEKRKGILIGSVLLIIIGILVIVSLRNNIKKNKTIYQKNQRLSEEKIKTQALLQENLEHKLEFRNKELTNLALFISQRTSIYKDFTESLKSLNFKDLTQLKKEINKLIKDYSFKFVRNDDVKNFHSNIETLQSDFLFKIKNKYPHLTNKDIQLAVQVKLKLSSKEIANINNISLNSVEIGRHRLRKKLGLEKKDNLVNFLENI